MIIHNLVKFAKMKKVMVLLMAVFLYSQGALCQVQSVVRLGTAALEKNNFSQVKQMFNDEGFAIAEYAPSNSDTYAVGMDGRGDFSLMWSIEANPNHTIKEVSFLCGAMYWCGIEDVLKQAGYVFVRKGTATLGNGAVVPQKTYSKKNKRCMVRTLDNAMAQVVFKRQATSTVKRKR